MKIKLNQSRVGLLCASVTLIVTLSSCFTGVEGTKQITEKDVRKAYSNVSHTNLDDSLLAYSDSLPAWHKGKTFTVADDQIRLIFAPSEKYDITKLRLAGKSLEYRGYTTSTLLDNRKILNVQFYDGDHMLVYPSGKTITDFNAKTSIPFLIDNDFVAYARKLLAGRIVYIKTPIWYDVESEEMVSGRKFIAVRIDSVLPGNKVFPLKVAFTSIDNGKSAFIWMAIGDTFMRNRSFDSLFSITDIHKSYPDISAENWERIINGRVAVDMTKEECTLSKGSPKTISRVPDQSGMREYWYYDGGSYLYFVDGLLKGFRE